MSIFKGSRRVSLKSRSAERATEPFRQFIQQLDIDKHVTFGDMCVFHELCHIDQRHKVTPSDIDLCGLYIFATPSIILTVVHLCRWVSA